MKNIVSFLLFISCFSVGGQQIKLLDTIYANDQKNVALFFPNPIRQGITGSDHFVFTYNREKEQYFGLLQAAPGVTSNLLTVTKDGHVYSYILKYKKELQKLNYFIDINESIGNEKPVEVAIRPMIKPVSESENRITYFKKISEYLLKSRHEKIAVKRNNSMRLELQKVFYNASEVYLVIEVKNMSGIDFEIDFLNIYITNGNKKRKASLQRLKQAVIYKHNMISVINDKQTSRIVYVLPKFVLDDNEKLMIELQELKGSRNLSLKSKIY